MALSYLTKYLDGETFLIELKEQLTEDDLYRQNASRNASSIATKFSTVDGLCLVLGEEINKMAEAREEAISNLKSLGERVALRDSTLISTAAHCSACRSFNATGIVCEHCDLDAKLMSWELRLFTLVASSRGKASLSTDMIANAIHQRNMYRVGRGGLGEASHLHDGGSVVAKRTDNKVSDTKVLRSPSEVEKALRYIASKLRSIKPKDAEEAKELQICLQEGKCFLEVMEIRRKEFIKAGAVASAQRQALYSMDELDMCIMRMRYVSYIIQFSIVIPYSASSIINT